jgi:hypothetical protein
MKKFDVVVGNPPYATLEQMETKRNGSKMASIGKLLPDFIALSCKLASTILYICPPSSEKIFRKQGKHINSLYFINQKHWGKRVAAIGYIVSDEKTNTIINNPEVSKLLEYNPDRHIVDRDKEVLYLYNFTTRTIVGKTPKHYSDCKILLSPTEQNIRNITILLKYIQPFMVNHINSWTSVNKKLKYSWLEGLNRDITNQDIEEYIRKA